LAPCYWHRHIEAGDLGSHTYNAWLAQLIRAGRAPGLRLVRQYNNVLFDWVLDAATRILGFDAGERLCASLAVLLFFWGGFTLISVIAGPGAWRATPLLGMVTYGWTFQMGFFNYYVGLGLAFFALAACWRSPRAGAVVSLTLLPLIWLAHPLSAAVLVGMSTYIIAAKRVPLRFHPLIVLGCFAVLLASRVYLAAHFDVIWENSDPFFLNGTDQLVIFGQRYAVLAYAVLALLLAAFIYDGIIGRRELESRAVLAEIYLMAFLTVLWLPDVIPLRGHVAPLSMITVRLTSVCAVLGCAWFAAIRPRAWQVAALSVAAAVFFGMIYQDTGTLSRAEDIAVRLVSEAAGQRVTFVGRPTNYDAGRIGDGHLIDRACAGRCFSFSDYEVPSEQFRVRATNGNGIVAAQAADSAAMQLGTFVVRTSDLPVLSVYQCGPALTDLCSRHLVAGDRNGRGAY
jgi:hypothetical protein